MSGDTDALSPHRSFLFLVSEAKSTIRPTKGVRANEQKKYPQKPNFLFRPNQPIIRLITIANRKSSTTKSPPQRTERPSNAQPISFQSQNTPQRKAKTIRIRNVQNETGLTGSLLLLSLTTQVRCNILPRTELFGESFFHLTCIKIQNSAASLVMLDKHFTNRIGRSP